jgi:hypothetical protein
MKEFLGHEVEQAEETVKRAKATKYEAAILMKLTETESVEVLKAFVLKKNKTAGDVMDLVFQPLKAKVDALVSGGGGSSSGNSKAKPAKK